MTTLHGNHIVFSGLQRDRNAYVTKNNGLNLTTLGEGESGVIGPWTPAKAGPAALKPMPKVVRHSDPSLQADTGDKSFALGS
jgi:hypothetical protein